MVKARIEQFHQAMKEEELNFSEYARSLGISRFTLYRILNSQRDPSALFIEAVINKYGTQAFDKFFYSDCNQQVTPERKSKAANA